MQFRGLAIICPHASLKYQFAAFTHGAEMSITPCFLALPRSFSLQEHEAFLRYEPPGAGLIVNFL